MPGFPAGAHLKGGATSAVVNRQLAREFYSPLLPIVLELHRAGKSLREIARELDRRGIKTRFEYPGQRWSAMQVKRVLARAIEAAAATPEASQRLDRRAMAVDLMERCRVAGITFYIENGKLYYKATDEAQQDVALIEEVRSDELDAELIELVTGAGDEAPADLKTIKEIKEADTSSARAKAGELVHRCRSLGYGLTVNQDGGLLVSLPPETKIPDDLWADIEAHHAEMVALVTGADNC
jgi:hypothetical protein